MELTTREAIQIMHRLGVEFVDCKHHIRGFVVVNGRRVLPVHCSNGRKSLPGHVPELFRKSLRLSHEQFEQVRNGRLDREDYAAILRKLGIA